MALAPGDLHGEATPGRRGTGRAGDGGVGRACIIQSPVRATAEPLHAAAGTSGGASITSLGAHRPAPD